MKSFAVALLASVLMSNETSAIRILVEDPGDSMEMKVETAIVKEEIKNKMKAKELEDYIKYHYDKVGGGSEASEEVKEEKKAAKKEAKKAEKKAEKKDAKEEKKDAKEEKKDEKKEEEKKE